VLWLVSGGLWGLGLVSIASIGLLVMPVALVVTVVTLFLRHGVEPATYLALAGLGLSPLYVGILNWGGPTTCPTSGTGTVSSGDAGFSCTDLLNPYPWLAVGALLILAGVLLSLGVRRKLLA